MTAFHVATTIFFLVVLPAIITIALIKTFKGE
jgi:hypothetical protein